MQDAVCLAIDTSYAQGCVVLFRGEEIFLKAVLSEKFAHGKLLCRAIEQAMLDVRARDCKLDVLLCGIGPGSFVGVRIALATALGFALGRGLPLMGVCSHRALHLSTECLSNVYMKASGDVGYLSHSGHSDIKLVSLTDVPNEVSNEAVIYSDQADRLQQIVAPSIVVNDLRGPNVSGLHRAALERVRRTGIVDEIDFIKPNYVKPPSVSVPKI